MLGTAVDMDGNSIRCHYLKDLYCHVNTTGSLNNHIKLHRLSLASCVWTETMGREFHFLTGSHGILFDAKLERITNVSNQRRCDRCVIQLRNITNAKTEDGDDIDFKEQLGRNGMLLVETKMVPQKIQRFLGRTIRGYLAPKDLYCEIRRPTALKDLLSSFLNKNRSYFPLINLSVLSVRHDRKTKSTTA